MTPKRSDTLIEMFLHFPLLKTPPPRWHVQNTPWELFEYLLSTSTSLNTPVSERHWYLRFFIMAGAITWSTMSLDMPELATAMYTLCPTNGLPMCTGSHRGWCVAKWSERKEVGWCISACWASLRMHVSKFESVHACSYEVVGIEGRET